MPNASDGHGNGILTDIAVAARGSIAFKEFLTAEGYLPDRFFNDHRLGADDSDPETISLQRISSVLGADWRFYHTTERNLGKLAELRVEVPLTSAAYDAAEQIESLSRAINEAPKTRGWRMRSRIGERMRWYETPEEVGH